MRLSPSREVCVVVLRWPVVWALSRRVRNRIQKAMRGNLKVTVANITALSNLRLVVGDDPDVILVQELWATKLQVEQAAKEFGYVAACGPGEQCLAAVLFKAGMGQQLHLPFEGEWARRTAAATISLGEGYGCCVASVYGFTGPTAAQRRELSQTLVAVLGEFRSRGRGPGLVGGDFEGGAFVVRFGCCAVRQV